MSLWQNESFQEAGLSTSQKVMFHKSKLIFKLVKHGNCCCNAWIQFLGDKFLVLIPLLEVLDFKITFEKAEKKKRSAADSDDTCRL